MRRIIVVFTILLMSSFELNVAQAQLARGGGGARPAVGNRSVGTMNAGNVNRGNINRGNINQADVNRGNVNRTNINQNNVNVNRNVNVDNHGWGNNYWVDDNHWNWGSFATGAAAGATGAAIGAAAGAAGAAAATPATGTVVTSLPPTCAPVPGGTALYNCAGTYYQPSYEGSNLVYQVVQHP